MENKTQITKDQDQKKILVSRTFDSSLEQLWNAWTSSTLLEKWWAPKPWVAVTKSLDFRNGGFWHYYMQGPDGTKHWCRVDFSAIKEMDSFEGQDSFCDEEGNKKTDVASMHWKNKFSATDTGSRIDIVISFASLADMQQIVDMGFEEGFTMALGNLDELFASK